MKRHFYVITLSCPERGGERRITRHGEVTAKRKSSQQEIYRLIHADTCEVLNMAPDESSTIFYYLAKVKP